MHIRHILVPTDFSDGSTRAFATAIDMARDSGARLTLLHVNQVPINVFPDAILPVSPDLMHELERAAETALERWSDEARDAGVDVEARMALGATADEICAAADEIDADLIVIGTHGRSGLSHVLLGSVAEKVVRKAPCPVLTVRPHMHSTFAQP